MDNNVTPKRPIGPGWISLKTWADMQIPPCPWDRALDYANPSPSCRRTSTVFHKEDLDRRTRKDIHVWYQPPHPVTGRGRPRFVRRKSPEAGSVHEVREGHELEV